MNRTPTTDVPLRTVRCAIYTRKSTEEGLEQEFNSLDAQREAAESYIASQRHEGWIAMPAHYDDGGFSGGNLQRPAMQRLLDDMAARRIDCVVVYKVDRLSRSLLDFAKLMAAFDEHRVSFVSVTQQFNTTTSMGRLTLNILLSFAQFEREIIGERIRDKIAAAKRKGKHTGGLPVLGYDLDRANQRLVVNDAEAALVRRIFERFVKVGSPLLVANELNAEGIRTKTWTLKNGKVRHGVPWNKHHVSRVLNNRKYIGQVVHKDQVYPGEQDAIVPQKLWNAAHKILSEHYRDRGNRNRCKTPALLKGVIKCGACGCTMGITYTRRRGKMYRYYLCVRASKHGYYTCPVKTISAGAAEEAVVDRLRTIFQAPEIIAKTFRATRNKESDELDRLRQEKADIEDRLRVLNEMAAPLMRPSRNGGRSSGAKAAELQRLRAAIDEIQQRLDVVSKELCALETQAVTERDVIEALRSLETVWDELFPVEQSRVIRLLVQQVVVMPGGMDLRIRATGLHSLATELRETLDQADGRSTRR